MASGVVQLQRLQDGAGQKTDALILQGTDGQALNNLTSAPHAICSIGQILCVAAKKDFDLRGDGKDAKPKLVEHPESFRATLVQVARESHGAFQKLGLQMGEVPEHLKQTVKLLLNKDQMPVRQMGKHVQIQLESVEKVGETCLELAESTHAKFDGVMQLLWETQMLLTAKKGATEKEKEDIASKQKAASMSLEAMKGSKTKLEEEFGKLDKEATEAREDMKKIMDSKPSGGDLIGAAFAEAGCALIQSLGQAAGQAAVMYAGGGAGAAAQGLGALGKADAKAAPARGQRRGRRLGRRPRPLRRRLLRIPSLPRRWIC
ncbi:unnamed protein product [Effrenium voratum]|nr:unnamed protein product [Effrenium voratum]